MKLNSTISVLAATLLISGASAATAGDKNKNKNKHQNQPQNSQMQQSGAASYGLGVAEANRRGASAGGVIGSGSMTEMQRQGRGPNGELLAPTGTTTTFGTGAIYTDQNTASGAASTGATASGAGTNTASSEVDVYGVVDGQGSEAGAYGASSAEAQQPRKPRRRPR